MNEVVRGIHFGDRSRFCTVLGIHFGDRSRSNLARDGKLYSVQCWAFTYVIGAHTRSQGLTAQPLYFFNGHVAEVLVTNGRRSVPSRE